MHGLNCYHTYGPEFMTHDLGHYLGAEFAGEWLSTVRAAAAEAADAAVSPGRRSRPARGADVEQPLGDGLPETLAEWIRANGLTHLKIKLNGDDLGWDVASASSASTASATEAQAARGVQQLALLARLQRALPDVALPARVPAPRSGEQTPAGFERIQYIEQPTARDLKANRDNVMHEAAKLRPVVIDESLIDLESLQLAREMGYTGAALKACKGQTQSLLLAAAAQKYGLFLCVQDLTCPGASLIHSAGLAAHVPGVAAIESNARQYCRRRTRRGRSASRACSAITDGTIDTSKLTGPGLSLPDGPLA